MGTADLRVEQQQRCAGSAAQRHEGSGSVLPSWVMKMLRASSMPALRIAVAVEASSADIQCVLAAVLTAQMKLIRRSGRRCVDAREAISSRIGSVKVTPVEPAMRIAQLKAAKSTRVPP